MIAVPAPWAPRFLRPLQRPGGLSASAWACLLIGLPVWWLLWLPMWGVA